MADKKNYYITTPIYYPSGKLTIGHAYTTITGDVIKRYKKQQGYDVFYLTGMDEHGEKIEKKAKANGVEPQAFVDEAAKDIKKLWKLLDIDYDKFIRTTDPQHEKVVQDIFDKLVANDDIYKSKYQGLYCVSCETYVTKSSAENNKCPDCGAELKVVEEESYFFKCSKYVDRLVEHMNSYPEFILPEKRKNELLNTFIKPGLEDLAVSRTSFKWGVPVKNDENHVIYVWIDALSNYITALGYGTDNDELFKKFWPADVHLMGKEIIRFHVIYWPMILMALGLELPKQIFAHGWLLMDRDKISKSKGNVIYPEFIVENYGLDPIRYYLMREVPFGEDGQFTPETFVNRINNDLANDLGNLVNRTINMTNKYFDGEVKDLKLELEYSKELNDKFNSSVSEVEKQMEGLKFSRSLDAIWQYISYVNKYVDLNEPWVLAKDDNKKDELNQVLFDLLLSIEKVAYLINFVMPNTAKEITKQIQVEYDDTLNPKDVSRETYKVTDSPKPIYPRLDVEEEVGKLQAEMDNNMKMAKEKLAQENQNLETISIDEFDKVKLVVGQIVEAEKHPKADKLLKFKIDTKSQTKQIISGLAKYYKPEDLIGKKVLIVDNLKEVKLRGELSQGMILTTEDENGVKIVEMENHNIGDQLS